MPRRVLYAVSSIPRVRARRERNEVIRQAEEVRRMGDGNGKEIGKIIHQRRRMAKLTLQRLSSLSGVSPSHLARIERRERFPSARILRKIAKPLEFDENELFVMAGYLSRSGDSEARQSPCPSGLDPYVASVIAQEPFRVQRAVVDILSVLRGLAGAAERQ